MTEGPAELGAWPANPFSPGRPLEAAWMVGREDELQKLRKAIREYWTRMVVRGPRGMGKTTLIRSLAVIPDVKVVSIDIRDHVDPRDVARPEAIVRSVTRALLGELPGHFEIPAHLSSPVATEQDLNRILQYLCEVRKLSPVIVIDEMDFLDLEAQRAIVRLAAAKPGVSRSPLWLFVVGESWGSTGYTSPIPGHVPEIALSLLDHETIVDLLRRFPKCQLFAFEQSAADLLYAETSGHPLFVAAVLDAIYDSRWAADDRSEVTREEIRRVVAAIERRPSDRIIHALRQAGPAVRVVLRTLAEDGREALSSNDLREVFRVEWPGWVHEVGTALMGLEASGLLNNDRGVWSHRIPILRGYVARLERTDIAAGDQPPRPDAWMAFREGQELERNGQTEAAIAAYQKAADLDPEFWLARWQLARQLIEPTEGIDEQEEHARLLRARAYLRQIEEKGATGTAPHRAIRDALCRTLLKLAISLPKHDANRREFIDELQRYDEHLSTPGAADVVAETMVAAWTFEQVKGEPRLWADRTRRILRSQPYVGMTRLWKQVAQWAIRRMDNRSEEFTESARTLDLIRFVVPVLLEERSFDEEVERLWEAIRSWLRQNVRVPLLTDGAYLDGQAWDTLLRTALGPGQSGAELILEELIPWLQYDFRFFLESGSGAETEQLLRSVLDPQVVATESRNRAREVSTALWQILEEVVLSCGQSATHDRILESLGRALLTFQSTGRVSREDVDGIISIYTESNGGGPAIRATTSAVDVWQTLLRERTANLFLNRLQPDLTLVADDWVDEAERKQIENWLDGAYKIERRCPIRLMGYPANTLKNVMRAYVAARVDGDDTDRVMIRTFQMRSPDGNTATLIKAMWERERRAIATLSLTPAGRALVQYREDRWLESENIALLVTDWPGPTTLRDVLRQNRVTSMRTERGRRTFWGQLLPLLEGVHALHRAGFLHRAISPEAIYDRSVETVSTEVRALILGHFEWSVYLRRLDGLGPYKHRELNRYLAPEALRAALGIVDRLSGETFGSDLYAIGLTLFECLVRPFTSDDELETYKSQEAYGVKAQDAHRDWLHGLRTEARKNRLDGKIDKFEETILAELLQFDVGKRPSTLEPVLDMVRQSSLRDRSHFRKPLPVFTTLRCHHESGDPRKDISNIAFFLRRELPELDLTTDLMNLSAAGLARIVADDLSGASIFLNRDTEAPLLLSSRSGTLYRLRHFTWDGQQRPKLAFLEVAHQYQGDEPIGEPIGLLHAGVEVLDIGMGEQKVTRIITDYTERGWSDLFEIAGSSGAFVETENREREKRLTLLDVLGVSNEVEYALAWQEAAFIRAKKGTALVCAPSGQENLATTVSAWLARDLWIEVARPREAAGTGSEVGLVFEALDLESGTVDLSSGGISADAIPEVGVLRPTGNRGVATMYRRRKDLLQQIREDTTLLNSVIAPAEVTVELPKKLLRRVNYFIARLDEEKKKIIERYRRTRPLLVVQGPPGTGKTTLATEVVLQTLDDISNARILITAQGHAPLDNLLVRLLQEKERNPDAEKKLQEVEIVRLKSGNRTDSEYPELVRNHLPYERADQLFRALRQESEKRKGDLGLDGLVARQIVEVLAPYASAPTSLLRRVEESANLVFVTTNAREVEEAVSGSFDVVIVEEAARCVPMELLSVMRLSRHWLLIGDHQQLPPFGYELVMNEVKRRITALIEDVEVRRLMGRSPGEAISKRDRVELEASRLQRLLRATPRYMNLFKHLHASGEYKVSATLRTQWRMHPTLGTMVSDVFYGGEAVVNPYGDELEALTKRTTHPFHEPPYLSKSQIVWIDFDPATVDAACRERRGPGGQLENEAERRTAVAFLRLLRNGRRSHDIAILTPYRKQMEQLRGLMSEQQNKFDAFGSVEDRIFTVDSFQGQQAATVVLSLVRNNDAVNPQSGIGFLAEPQRATVMFSRAERLLVILGCSAHFRRFAETAWVIDIFSRATVRPWTDFIPISERSKLDEYRF